MKIVTLLVAACFFYVNADAQTPLTLSQTNFPSLQAGAMGYYNASIVEATPPKEGANQTWDYSFLKSGKPKSLILVPAPSFSPVAVADTSAYEYIGSDFGFPAAQVYDEDLNGFFLAGAIIPKQSYSLEPYTGTSGDSLFVPAQNYHVRKEIIPFPATYQSVWNTKTTHTVNISITVRNFFLKNTPAHKLTHTIASDSVAGWGHLSIPVSGKASIPYPVLLIKDKTITIDSFFLGNAPAPSILLNSFGIPQGDTTISYKEYFYRAGTGKPMMIIDYGIDSTFSNLAAITLTADSLQSGISPLQQVPENISLYPNPNTDGILHGSINKTSPATWTMEIVNSLGQLAQTQDISGFGHISLSINLNSSPVKGIYYVRIMDENGRIAGTGKLNKL